MSSATAPPVSEREFIFLLAAISGSTALGIDFTLPAFDQIEDQFGAVQLSLIVSVYFIGMAIGQPFYGPLADRFGRKVILRTGLFTYGIAAVLCGLAPSFELLLFGRFVWGLAAAGPRTMTLAIARDTFEGDRLARVVAAATAAFMIVPALAPVLGEGVLRASDWRATLAAPMVLALALLLWIRRLPETLPPEHRLPLSFAKIGNAFKAVTANKSTLGFTLAMMFDFASFGSFLSSSAQIFDEVFNRDSSFAVLFGLMSFVTGLVAYAGSRLVTTIGADAILNVVVPVGVVGSVVGLVISVAANGAPAFWPWFLLVVAINSLRTLLSSLAAAGAMAPMGAIAGTASAVIGTVQLGGGTALSALTDRAIDGSVTPLMVAYLVYGVFAWAAVRYGQKHRANSASTQ